MPIRPYLPGFIVGAAILFAILFSWGSPLMAQATTDFAAWKDAKNAKDVPEWARTLLNRDFRDITGTAREELLAKTLEALIEIVADSRVVPSTRYNAVLVSGQLVAAPGNPPAAYPAALLYLVDVYQRADTPHYIRCGALLGIVRHALCGIDPSQQERVIDLLLETVTTELYADTVSWAVGDWCRITALEGLAAMKITGTESAHGKGKVVSELLPVINRKTQELNNLCSRQSTFTRQDWEQARRAIELASHVAKTLGDLNYKDVEGKLVPDVDAKTMTDTFVGLIRAVCGFEYKMIVDTIDRKEVSFDSAILLEQIVVDIKMSTQSVAWGIRGWFLAGNPGENSLLASLPNDDPVKERLDIFLSEINELTAFLDEGDKAKKSTPAGNAPKAFKFDISELRDVLVKSPTTFKKDQTSGNE